MTDRIEELFRKLPHVINGNCRNVSLDEFRAAVAEILEEQRKPKGPHGSDSCWCGDYRSQHNEDGFCRVCGNSTAPYDGCREFRFAHHAGDAQMKHWQQYHGKLADQRDTQPYDEPTEKDIGPRSKRFDTQRESGGSK